MQEHEIKLKRLVDDEEDNKKKMKNITLKATSIEDMESEDEDSESEINKFVMLMFQKLKEFLRHKKQNPRLEKKSEKRSSSIHTCHQCGEKGHKIPNFLQNQNQRRSKKPQKK